MDSQKLIEIFVKKYDLLMVQITEIAYTISRLTEVTTFFMIILIFSTYKFNAYVKIATEK